MLKVRLSGVYQILHVPSGQYYIGESVDIFGRWAGHHTSLALKRHSSTQFQELWDSTSPQEWQWTIITIFSKSKFKSESGLKGRSLELAIKKQLRNLEREIMGGMNKGISLNKDKKYFKVE